MQAVDSCDRPKCGRFDRWLEDMRETYDVAQCVMSHLPEKMLLELPVCALCWSDGELIPQKLNDQVLG